MTMARDLQKWADDHAPSAMDALGNPWSELSRDHPDFHRRVEAVIKLRGTKYATDCARAAHKTLSGHDLRPMIGTPEYTEKARGG